jgi:hypothetical protein
MGTAEKSGLDGTRSTADESIFKDEIGQIISGHFNKPGRV